MSLYKQWTDMVVQYVKTRGEMAFWNEYGSVEQKAYIKILSNHENAIKGTIKDLAKEFEIEPIFFMGVMDGLNESLTNELDLEGLNEESEVELNIDFEKLYFNMLDAKADYLYNLPQWEAIFSEEKRKEIKRQWRDSKMVVKENKVGRNDPCTCGSGKKYKKCCGKNN